MIISYYLTYKMKIKINTDKTYFISKNKTYYN